MNRSSTLLLRCRESQHNSRYLGSRRPRPACEVSEEAAVQRWLKNNHPLVRRLEVRWFSFFRSLLHIGCATSAHVWMRAFAELANR